MVKSSINKLNISMNKIKAGKNVRFNNRNGFTLLEILIALFILGIALVPLISAQINSQGFYETSENVIYETVAAKNIMSKTLFMNNFNPYKKTSTLKSNKDYKYSVSISKSSFTGIYLIKVYVYERHYRNSGVELKTLAF